ncbi:MBL fold metallo-hydrolase [Oerskovia sp. KBS0722]|uniref:MBL fold metallo-hydrolase n=1 Tax=Oerskovia sp. KBS0722 TaxID=1179673 RepID=UPI00143D5A1E|nr:MBL fold metallo-hydrolase [Oerskovia sp. KBS0722]
MSAVTRWNRPARARTLRVGDLRVRYVPDGTVQLHPQRWFSLPEDDRSVPSGLLDQDGYLVGSVGALLVEAPGWSVLVDTGFGPRTLAAESTHPALGTLRGGGLDRLSPGVVEGLDRVLFTHLHEDHAGWLAHGEHPVGAALRSVPHVASSTELDAHPALARGAWEVAEHGRTILPGLTALASPGHTAGHTSYLLESRGERLLCFGDVMHSSVQVEQPSLGSCFEADPVRSRATRAETLDLLGEPGTVGAGSHFADVVLGRVHRTREGGRSWSPAEEASSLVVPAPL